MQVQASRDTSPFQPSSAAIAGLGMDGDSLLPTLTLSPQVTSSDKTTVTRLKKKASPLTTFKVESSAVNCFFANHYWVVTCVHLAPCLLLQVSALKWLAPVILRGQWAYQKHSVRNWHASLPAWLMVSANGKQNNYPASRGIFPRACGLKSIIAVVS